MLMGVAKIIPLLQGAAAAPTDSAEVMSAGIGTGSELALVAILAVALVGGAVAMLAGDRVRRAENARRPASWGGDLPD